MGRIREIKPVCITGCSWNKYNMSCTNCRNLIVIDISSAGVIEMVVDFIQFFGIVHQ